MIDGLAYTTPWGGNSLADKFAGTGIYRRRPTLAEQQMAEKAKRAAEELAAREFRARLQAGEEKRAVWRSGMAIRQVEVKRVVKGHGVRVTFDGCTLMVGLHELHPE